MKLINILFLFSFLLFAACSEDEGETTLQPGAFVIEFDNRVGTTNLQLNTTNTEYTNENGDPFNVTMLKYYISNIKLTDANGNVFEDPTTDDGSKGYYLVDAAAPESHEITLNDIPAGDYEKLEFTIGVDAERVSEGAQTGALDPVNEMFWSWNAGWIFYKFEGTSPNSTEEGNVVVYHIGGYKDEGQNLRNNIKTKTLTFDGAVKVAADKKPQAHIVMDVLQVFKEPTMLDFSTNAQRHSPASCVEIANNYVDAFILDHVHE
jgi:hypothetical protein